MQTEKRALNDTGKKFLRVFLGVGIMIEPGLLEPVVEFLEAVPADITPGIVVALETAGVTVENRLVS
jgi:hypothetical protein